MKTYYNKLLLSKKLFYSLFAVFLLFDTQYILCMEAESATIVNQDTNIIKEILNEISDQAAFLALHTEEQKKFFINKPYEMSGFFEALSKNENTKNFIIDICNKLETDDIKELNKNLTDQEKKLNFYTNLYAFFYNTSENGQEINTDTPEWILVNTTDTLIKSNTEFCYVNNFLNTILDKNKIIEILSNNLSYFKEQLTNQAKEIKKLEELKEYLRTHFITLYNDKKNRSSLEDIIYTLLLENNQWLISNIKILDPEVIEEFLEIIIKNFEEKTLLDKFFSLLTPKQKIHCLEDEDILRWLIQTGTLDILYNLINYNELKNLSKNAQSNFGQIFYTLMTSDAVLTEENIDNWYTLISKFISIYPEVVINNDKQAFNLAYWSDKNIKLLTKNKEEEDKLCIYSECKKYTLIVNDLYNDNKKFLDENFASIPTESQDNYLLFLCASLCNSKEKSDIYFQKIHNDIIPHFINDEKISDNDYIIRIMRLYIEKLVVLNMEISCDLYIKIMKIIYNYNKKNKNSNTYDCYQWLLKYSNEWRGLQVKVYLELLKLEKSNTQFMSYCDEINKIIYTQKNGSRYEKDKNRATQIITDTFFDNLLPAQEVSITSHNRFCHNFLTKYSELLDETAFLKKFVKVLEEESNKNKITVNNIIDFAQEYPKIYNKNLFNLEKFQEIIIKLFSEDIDNEINTLTYLERNNTSDFYSCIAECFLQYKINNIDKLTFEELNNLQKQLDSIKTNSIKKPKLYILLFLYQIKTFPEAGINKDAFILENIKKAIAQSYVEHAETPEIKELVMQAEKLAITVSLLPEKEKLDYIFYILANSSNINDLALCNELLTLIKKYNRTTELEKAITTIYNFEQRNNKIDLKNENNSVYLNDKIKLLNEIFNKNKNLFYVNNLLNIYVNYVITSIETSEYDFNYVKELINELLYDNDDNYNFSLNIRKLISAFFKKYNLNEMMEEKAEILIQLAMDYINCIEKVNKSSIMKDTFNDEFDTIKSILLFLKQQNKLDLATINITKKYLNNIITFRSHEPNRQNNFTIKLVNDELQIRFNKQYTLNKKKYLKMGLKALEQEIGLEALEQNEFISNEDYKKLESEIKIKSITDNNALIAYIEVLWLEIEFTYLENHDLEKIEKFLSTLFFQTSLSPQILTLSQVYSGEEEISLNKAIEEFKQRNITEIHELYYVLITNIEKNYELLESLKLIKMEANEIKMEANEIKEAIDSLLLLIKRQSNVLMQLYSILISNETLNNKEKLHQEYIFSLTQSENTIKTVYKEYNKIKKHFAPNIQTELIIKICSMKYEQNYFPFEMLNELLTLSKNNTLEKEIEKFFLEKYTTYALYHINNFNEIEEKQKDIVFLIDILYEEILPYKNSNTSLYLNLKQELQMAIGLCASSLINIENYIEHKNNKEFFEELILQILNDKSREYVCEFITKNSYTNFDAKDLVKLEANNEYEDSFEKECKEESGDNDIINTLFSYLEKSTTNIEEKPIINMFNLMKQLTEKKEKENENESLNLEIIKNILQKLKETNEYKEAPFLKYAEMINTLYIFFKKINQLFSSKFFREKIESGFLSNKVIKVNKHDVPIEWIKSNEELLNTFKNKILNVTFKFLPLEIAALNNKEFNEKYKTRFYKIKNFLLEGSQYKVNTKLEQWILQFGSKKKPVIEEEPTLLNKITNFLPSFEKKHHQ